MNKTLLRQNSELRKDHVWNWTLPAWVTRLADGRVINVCPQAGACAKLCYARNGSYLFSNVLTAHQSNLMLAMDRPQEFVDRMSAELHSRRFQPKGYSRDIGLESHAHLDPKMQDLLVRGAAAIRIHDSGDFFSDEYLMNWITIAREHDNIIFYAYTKEVSRFRRVLETLASVPSNFLWVYSLGGKEDHLLDLELDRHADVFPSEAAIAEAGYFSQDDNDLLCVLAPSNKVGIPANRIRHFQKRQGERTFGQIEAGSVRHGR